MFQNRTALICPTIFNLTKFFKCTLLFIVSRFVTTNLMDHSVYLTWHMLFIQNCMLCTLWLYWKCSSFIDLLTKNRSTHNISICYFFFMWLHCTHSTCLYAYWKHGMSSMNPVADWLASVQTFPQSKSNSFNGNLLKLGHKA